MVDVSNFVEANGNAAVSIPAMEVAGSPHVPFVPRDANATDSKNAKDVLDLWRQQKQIPAPFIWPHADARPSSILELDVPVVDIGAALHSAAGMARAAAQVAEACASHGFFQVTGHGVDPALAQAALDGAADFFRLPLATKQRARRSPGTVKGYASAHADRFAAKLPWKETLSFIHNHVHEDVGARASSHVVDYFTSALGDDFMHLGEVYQEYCEAMEDASLAIMEVLGVSLGLGRGYYRDFFADGSSIMRCNYYPRCPEPDRTLGTGPHCDPSALTILLQDGEVDGLQVLVDGAWRSVRPKPGELVVNIGDTFMALSNGRYKSCLHRAVVHREKERRSLAYFLAPQEDRVVRPPPSPAPAPRLYPDFTWAELMRFTQRHYRADARTLDAFACWLDLPSCPATPQAQGTV
ncbi:gibberellin 20 oxidase 2-like [Hordeum vulgare subsp. vulgare]|uniref:Fe2OG dioxygenase domain-containing protein n=1 Tax=Hordeum vulgare subsp. vulgare TaxID=112509 RepID=A0A8I7B3I4_HORVV|nr:gibberellin 20 oxidase 2-like [Hordeum vulgare subsp. vulgare]